MQVGIKPGPFYIHGEHSGTVDKPSNARLWKCMGNAHIWQGSRVKNSIQGYDDDCDDHHDYVNYVAHTD